MKCHWCDTESRNVFCSPECVVEHNRRFTPWLEDMGFTENMRTKEMIDEIDWNLDTDGSVISYTKGNLEIWEEGVN